MSCGNDGGGMPDDEAVNVQLLRVPPLLDWEHLVKGAEMARLEYLKMAHLVRLQLPLPQSPD